MKTDIGNTLTYACAHTVSSATTVYLCAIKCPGCRLQDQLNQGGCQYE